MNLFDVYPLYEVTPKKAKDVFVFDENQNKLKPAELKIGSDWSWTKESSSAASPVLNST